MVSSILKTSLEECEQEGLITSFLIARQASLEGPHIFPSYQDWFQVRKCNVTFFLKYRTFATIW